MGLGLIMLGFFCGQVAVSSHLFDKTGIWLLFIGVIYNGKELVHIYSTVWPSLFIFVASQGGENLSTCSNLKTRKSLFSKVGVGKNERVIGQNLQIYHVQVWVEVKWSFAM